MDELIKQLEILNKNVDNLNNSFKGMMNDKKLADESSVDIEEVQVKYLSCDSSNFHKNDIGYFMDCNFILDEKFEFSLNEFKDRKIELGVIYGEFEPGCNFTLARASHVISDIEISDIGLDMISVGVTCKLLNTTYGKRLKGLVDDGVEGCLEVKLKYITIPDIKIFTVDITVKK